jgi:hypothetical protein
MKMLHQTNTRNFDEKPGCELAARPTFVGNALLSDEAFLRAAFS